MHVMLRAGIGIFAGASLLALAAFPLAGVLHQDHYGDSNTTARHATYEALILIIQAARYQYWIDVDWCLAAIASFNLTQKQQPAEARLVTADQVAAYKNGAKQIRQEPIGLRTLSCEPTPRKSTTSKRYPRMNQTTVDLSVG